MYVCMYVRTYVRMYVCMYISTHSLEAVSNYSSIFHSRHSVVHPAPFLSRAHWQAGVDGVQLVHLTQQGLLNLGVDSEEHVKCLPRLQGSCEINVDTRAPCPLNALPGR